MHSAVGDAEEVLDSHFVPRRQLQQDDAGGHVLVLGHPVCKNIFRRRPSKVLHTGHLDAALVQQTERGRFVNAESAIFGHSGEELVVVTPLENGPNMRHLKLKHGNIMVISFMQTHVTADQKKLPFIMHVKVIIAEL